MPDSFVHLHLHTEYSILDGAVRIPELMKRAKELGMPAVAMTDHGNLFGAVEFYQEAHKAGIKPILGCEVYLAPGPMSEMKDVPGRKRASHLTLLAADNTGYENLVKLVTKGHLDGLFEVPRVDKEALAEHARGLIALSGCMKGELIELLTSDREDEARRSLGTFCDIFGKENFFIEMHNHGDYVQHQLMGRLTGLARDFGLKTVAANDVHFLHRADHESHDILVCLGAGATVHDEKRHKYPEEAYFKTPDEMLAMFEGYEEACATTLEIAERCNVTMKLDASSIEKYPQFQPPGGETREACLQRLCEEGLVKHYGRDRALNDTELRARLDYELGIINKMNFSSYFLIVWDFIKWAKEHGIPVGPGRGSGAGSLVAYTLGITDLCPLRFGLIFERFLNPERVSPPDLDIDFCQTRRPEVIDYVRHRYGERSVSNIITFGTLGAKSVVRDVGRVLGMGYGDTDRIAKMIPAELNITLEDAAVKNPELKALIADDANVQQLWRHATFLEGLTRNAGIHAAGVVIGDRPLDTFIPLTRGAEGEVVSQFAMGPLTDVGMLKMDFLGLKTLSIIEEAQTFVRRRVPDFDIEKVPLDDRATYELMQRGELIAIFQMESGGMTNACRQLVPDRIEEIIALLALYRPGPMDLIPSFVKRKKGEEKVEHLHPLLEEVTQETYGILIYQEQVQKAANLLAGYTLGAADMLRRAMGKKKPEEMAKQRAIFVKGCMETNGISEKKANDIFDLLEKFAGYGFNKSHSAAYGIITYRTAYLKAHFPVEFMAAVLSFESNSTEKLAGFIAECRRMGIALLPPDVNRGQLRFTPECIGGSTLPNAIRFGLAAVKNVGESAMAGTVAERGRGGPFTGLEDFCQRVDTRLINKRLLEALIKVGAFDFTGEGRAALFARLDAVLASAAGKQRAEKAGLVSLFGEDEMSAAKNPLPNAAAATPWTSEEVMTFEKELLGWSVSGHPLDRYRHVFESRHVKPVAEVLEMKGEKEQVRCAGLVQRYEVKFTKKDNRAFATFAIEDFTGVIEAIAWNETFEKSREVLKEGAPVGVRARTERDLRSDAVRLTVQEIKPLPLPKENTKSRAKKNGQPAPEEEAPPLELRLDAVRHTPADLEAICAVLRAHPGDMRVHLRVRSRSGESGVLCVGEEFRVERSDDLAKALGFWMV